MNNKYLLLASLALVTLVGCTNSEVAKTNQHEWLKNKPDTPTILHTNDNHGHFLEKKYGELGIAIRTIFINKIQDNPLQSGDSVLFLSAKDRYLDIRFNPNHARTGYTDANILKEYIKKNSPINIINFTPNNKII